MLSIFLYIAAGAIIGLIFYRNGFGAYLDRICEPLEGMDLNWRAFVAVLVFGGFWPIMVIAPIRRAIQGKPFWDHEQ